MDIILLLAALAAHDSAGAIMIEWATRVRAGAGAATWAAASLGFQQRIAQERWRGWVESQQGQWEGVGPPRILRFVDGRDEAPLPPGEWAVVVLAHDRAAGGQVLERVWAVREPDSTWRVVDYAVWPDSKAIVSNAYFAPIPYFGGRWLDAVSLHRIRRVPTHRADPVQERAVANPRTFPSRPPR